MKKLLFLTAVAFLFATCKKGHELDCVKSAGKVVSKTYELESFSQIDVQGIIELELVGYSNKPKIEIEYNKNLIDGLEKDVKDGVLKLKDANVCNWVRSYNVQPKVKLYYDKNLSEINLYGAVKLFNTDSLNLENLVVNSNTVENTDLSKINVSAFEINGFSSGGFIINGRSGYITTTITDVSFLDMQDFVVDDLYLYHYSLRSSHVKSRDIMKIELYGEGDVYIDEYPSDTSRWKCCQVDLQKLGKGDFK